MQIIEGSDLQSRARNPKARASAPLEHSGKLFGIKTLLMDISVTALHCWRVTWPLQRKANAIWVTPGGAYPQALDWH